MLPKIAKPPSKPGLQDRLASLGKTRERIDQKLRDKVHPNITPSPLSFSMNGITENLQPKAKEPSRQSLSRYKVTDRFTKGPMGREKDSYGSDRADFFEQLKRYSTSSTASEGPLTPRKAYINQCKKLSIVPEPLAPIISASSGATEMDLHGYGLGDKLADALGQGMGATPIIKSVNLSENRLSDQGMATLLTNLQHKKLEVLDLSNNGAVFQSVRVIGVLLTEKDCRLRKLVLDNNSLSDRGTKLLCEGLKKNQTLRELRIERNNIGVGGAKAIADFLSSPDCRLRVLSIAWNQIRGQGAVELAKGFAKNASLMELNISWNSFGVSAPGGGLKSSASSKAINRRTGSVGSRPGTRGSVSQNRASFSVGSDPKRRSISGAGAGAMKGGKQKGGNPQATTPVIQWLGTMLREHPRMVHIDMSCNQFNGEQCTYLADALRDNHTIMGIHMQGNAQLADAKGFLVTPNRVNDPRNLHMVTRVLNAPWIKGGQEWIQRSNCWICEKWRQVEINWCPAKCGYIKKNTVLRAHPSWDDFKADPMAMAADGQYRLWRMAPPGKHHVVFTLDHVPHALVAIDRPCDIFSFPVTMYLPDAAPSLKPKSTCDLTERPLTQMKGTKVVKTTDFGDASMLPCGCRHPIADGPGMTKERLAELRFTDVVDTLSAVKSPKSKNNPSSPSRSPSNLHSNSTSKLPRPSDITTSSPSRASLNRRSTAFSPSPSSSLAPPIASGRRSTHSSSLAQLLNNTNISDSFFGNKNFQMPDKKTSPSNASTESSNTTASSSTTTTNDDSPIEARSVLSRNALFGTSRSKKLLQNTGLDSVMESEDPSKLRELATKLSLLTDDHTQGVTESWISPHSLTIPDWINRIPRPPPAEEEAFVAKRRPLSGKRVSSSSTTKPPPAQIPIKKPTTVTDNTGKTPPPLLSINLNSPNGRGKASLLAPINGSPTDKKNNNNNNNKKKSPKRSPIRKRESQGVAIIRANSFDIEPRVDEEDDDELFCLPRPKHAITKIAAEKTAWKFEDSVFSDYKQDDDKILRAAFLKDWGYGKLKTMLEKQAEEMKEVKQLLWENYDTLSSIFKYYSPLSSGADPVFMGWNGFTELMNHCGIPDEDSCRLKDLDTVFITVNASKHKNLRNPSRALTRFKFLEALVRVAQTKFVRSKICNSIPVATRVLIQKHLLPFARRHRASRWRNTRVFQESCDTILKDNLDKLHVIFERHSGRFARPGAPHYMSLEEWTDLMEDSHIVDENFTARELRFSFVWSLQTIIDVMPVAANAKFADMEFCEFLDGICHVAEMKCAGGEKSTRRLSVAGGDVFIGEGLHSTDHLSNKMAIVVGDLISSQFEDSSNSGTTASTAE
eukprot:TRINITY_DN307_c2_g4_i5.p1 TRINITY_DN307_c2_g4~~TRINITY_DN307_c2_g4_i5.p1  ORF type:complete len:1353 (+),score=428.01 TRINITY_DN307_c2_g4_i5:100-4158(+)